MDFEALWKEHWKLIVGGGAAVAVLALVMMRRSASPAAPAPDLSAGGGGGDNGETAAAISDLGSALGAQSDSFAAALGHMQEGQQAYFSSLADLLNSQDHAAASQPIGSSTTISYYMPPAPAADAPQAPVASSLSTIADTYGNNAIWQGTAQEEHAAKDAERLKNDPAFRQSEIQRALHVIDFRKKQNLDTSQQEGYLKSLVAG